MEIKYKMENTNRGYGSTEQGCKGQSKELGPLQAQCDSSLFAGGVAQQLVCKSSNCVEQAQIGPHGIQESQGGEPWNESLLSTTLGLKPNQAYAKSKDRCSVMNSLSKAQRCFNTLSSPNTHRTNANLLRCAGVRRRRQRQRQRQRDVKSQNSNANRFVLRSSLRIRSNFVQIINESSKLKSKNKNPKSYFQQLKEDQEESKPLLRGI